MAAADHLQAPRHHGLFVHHGIDLGDGTVAHYLEGREILRNSKSDFSQGESISKVYYPDGNCSATGVTLRRAMSRLGEQRYNLLFNNCEHFAHWCKTGRHRSSQVEDFLANGSLGAISLGQWMPSALSSGIKMVLKKGIQLDGNSIQQGQELIKRSIEQLGRIRRNLQQRLEEQLAKAEESWKGIDSSQQSRLWQQLRITTQNLADQLSQVEEMEDQLRCLLPASSNDRNCAYEDLNDN